MKCNTREFKNMHLLGPKNLHEKNYFRSLSGWQARKADDPRGVKIWPGWRVEGSVGAWILPGALYRGDPPRVGRGSADRQ